MKTGTMTQTPWEKIQLLVMMMIQILKNRTPDQRFKDIIIKDAR